MGRLSCWQVGLYLFQYLPEQRVIGIREQEAALHAGEYLAYFCRYWHRPGFVRFGFNKRHPIMDDVLGFQFCRFTPPSARA